MSPRQSEIGAFLKSAGWHHATCEPLAGDLSSRRYFRLHSATGETAVLMDAQPDQDATTPAFVSMSRWLQDVGLSAPRVLASASDRGLLLLEDFGDAKLTSLVQQSPTRQSGLYGTIIDVLVCIRTAAPPNLHRPTPVELGAATRLADAWYPKANPEGLAGLRATLIEHLGVVQALGVSVSLRDFHADNMIWLPKRDGPRRIGLLDYQDAFLIHPAYDLMSLITDARTVVSPTLAQQLIGQYCTATGDDRDATDFAIAVLGAQRNLRILGIFARAARRDGKTQHLKVLPRVYGHLAACLTHPAFDDVREVTLACLPHPNDLANEAFRHG